MTKAELVAILAQLGATYDAVAKTLHEAGLRGNVGQACNCPLAHYLAAHGFLAPEIHCGYVLTWGEAIRTPDGGRMLSDRIWVPLPEPVESFRLRFDAGEFPELTRP